jgi:hypothetical protein
MPDLGDDDIVPWVLDKLARHGVWKAKHTSIDNIPKGAPQHMRDRIKEAVRRLIKDNFILQKPTGYGLEVSLNFDRKNEIFDIIEKWKLKNP